MEKDENLEVISEILHGVSIRKTSFGLVYFKHISQIDQREILSKSSIIRSDAKEKGLDNPNKADISKDKDISDYEFKRGIAIQNAIDQAKNEMKVTDKDGNDVTSDIIKKLEKSLNITKGYTSDPELRKDDPRYSAHPTTKEVDDGKGGQQNPSEDEKENDNQDDLVAVFKEEDDDKKDWTPEDHEEEEE